MPKIENLARYDKVQVVRTFMTKVDGKWKKVSKIVKMTRKFCPACGELKHKKIW